MSSETENATPIRLQYLKIKQQYPDTILFFRLGDFYETFDADAETISRELDIVLTSRNIAKDTRVPMAGVPYHAVDNYLSRLIEKGFHVAICEQIGDQTVNGLVPRRVVRVVTPGTIIEPELLPGDRNNYLVSVVVQDNRAGFAYVDITTGEFSTSEITGEDIFHAVRSEIMRLRPAEILIPDTLKLPNDLPCHTTPWSAWRFEIERCRQELLTHFKTTSLDGFGLREMSLAIRSSGAILQYIQETQPPSLKLLTGLNTYHLSEFMTLDAATRRNLELTETIRSTQTHQVTRDGSLLSILDHTVSPMGKRLILQWVSKPLLDIPAILQRQEAVAFFVEQGILRAEIRGKLRAICDLERLVNRIISGHATPRDLTALRATLQALPGIKELFPIVPPSLAYVFQKNVEEQFELCSETLSLLENAITDNPPATLQHVGVIRQGYSTELDNTVEASRHAREWIANLENIERERTGIKNLKVGYNKVFGYFIEVTRSNTGSVPEEYIRKQTLVNAERYITPEMKEYETLVLNAEERIREIEGKLFNSVCDQVAARSEKIQTTARTLAELDTLASLSEAAAKYAYIRPELTTDTCLEISDGRHPVVEQTSSTSGERFVANDTRFEEGEIVRIITGPNMSGKSTFLRQAALITLMAQMGSFVPASAAKIGLVDRIFTRIGAQDEIHAGQSTFMVEMIETANILHHATNRSLLILDEIGRGTSTYDGVSIAWAVIEYIHNHPSIRSRTLFATHYHELTQLSEFLPGVRNYNVSVSESGNDVIFLHKIIPGGADRSYGIHVAQLAGLPQPVIQRASEILRQLEASSGQAVQINPSAPMQMALFPETNPLLDELKSIDINTLSPIEAINRLYEWQKKYLSNNG